MRAKSGTRVYSTASEAIIIVSIGISDQTTLSKKRSKAATNLLVWDTREPEKRSEWNCIDWAETASKARLARSYIAKISIFQWQ